MFSGGGSLSSPQSSGGAGSCRVNARGGSMPRAGGAHRDSARSRGGERGAATPRLVCPGRFGLHTAEGLSAPVPTPHTAVKRGAELRGQGAAGGIWYGVGKWNCPPFTPGGQLPSQPEVLSCVRGNLTKSWLDALGRGRAGAQRGRRSCCPQCRQSQRLSPRQHQQRTFQKLLTLPSVSLTAWGLKQGL